MCRNRPVVLMVSSSARWMSPRADVSAEMMPPAPQYGLVISCVAVAVVVVVMWLVSWRRHQPPPPPSPFRPILSTRLPV